MIRFEQATHKFETGSGIADVTFEVGAGEMAFIIGPTGAGKTTMLRMVYMEIFPDQGRVTVGEFDSTTIRKREIPLLRRKVGMVFQDCELLHDRSVFENVALPLRVRGLHRDEVEEKVSRVLGELGMSDKRHRRPAQLSGGEQQIVSLARAIAKEPMVVLADEPTGNLDPVSAFKVLSLLEQVHQSGTAVLMASHNYNLIKDRGHRFIEVVDGLVRA